MKFKDEFNDKRLIDKLLAEIRKSDIARASFMEICGTHTMAIFRSGLRELLGNSITLISGPGCPVCVTSQSDIDRMISLARHPKVILATFGDMLRVPGTKSSLEKERAHGSDIRIVYSPLDALAIARQNKGKQVVFLAVGFETTSPTVAAAVADARATGIGNFSIYCCHKLIPPAMKALLEAGEIHLDGFICPGHVSTIIGGAAYEFICRDYALPCVITGFEPVDILESLLMLLRQRARNKKEIAIQYSRAVKPAGNRAAQKLLTRVFEPCDAQWRGMGTIPRSGYSLKKEYRKFDAGMRFDIPTAASKENPRCLCGNVLRGINTPADCTLFASVCTPENPFGPCMVSTEGTCAAWYKYNREAKKTNTKRGRLRYKAHTRANPNKRGVPLRGSI